MLHFILHHWFGFFVLLPVLGNALIVLFMMGAHPSELADYEEWEEYISRHPESARAA